MTLTVCALAKDSEKILHRFFTCLEGCADQILIGDLGSADDTVNKAKEMGAQVVSLDLNHDYSAVRNALLSRATSEWVLFLDCSETISNPDLKRLKDFLDDTEHDVFIMSIKNYTDEKHLMGWRPSDLAAYSGYIPGKQARLFRNNSVISFSYPVNETILPSVNGTSFDVKEITDVVVHNHSYRSQIDEFFTILKKIHEKNPEDLHITYDLALAYLRKGRLSSAKRLFKDIVKKMPRYKNTLTNLATIYLKMGDNYKAAKVFLEAIKNNPKDLNAYHNLGQLFWKKKQYDKAEYLFQKALSVEPKEPRLIIALARTYKDNSKKDKAKELLERSLTLLPGNKMIKQALEKF